jgi:glucose/arabinose dehydrogenase
VLVRACLRGIPTALALLLLVATGATAAATVPEGFDLRQLADGLRSPTAAAVAPDGRTFVAEKGGRVQVVAPGEFEPELLLDLSAEVNSYSDRGLLGLALAHDFATTGRLYLLYVHDVHGGDTAGPAVSRLTRVEVGPDNSVGDEEVVLDGIPAEEYWHVIGTVRSAPDGTLWVGTGDATTRINERALESLSPHSLRGKILRVDDQGRGLPGAPFCPSETDLDAPCTKVFAAGFRNPFRFHLDAGGGLVVGDVGLRMFEELGRVEAGEVHGWPCYEGPAQSDVWEYHRTDTCQALYAAAVPGACLGAPHPATLTCPQHAYPHSGGAAVIAGPRYGGTTFPAEYHGSIFFGDYVHGTIRHLRPDGTVGDFGTGWRGVQLDPDAAGEDLISVEFSGGSLGTGSVWRLTYSPESRAPTARIAADPPEGFVPLTTRLSAAGSSDPDGDELTYRWDLGDGSPEVTGVDVEHTYTACGRYLVALTVEDPTGLRGYTRTAIQVCLPPTVELHGDETFRPGEPVAVDVTASDAEDGPLTGDSIAWEVVLFHNDHLHEHTQGTGNQVRFDADPVHAEDGEYELRVTATDSDGLQAKATRRIRYRPLEEPPGADADPLTPPAVAQPARKRPRLTLRGRGRVFGGKVRSQATPVRVRVALRRGCRWVKGRKLTRRRCGRPVWVAAKVRDGRWRYTLPRKLPGGRYRVRARATDAAGSRTVKRATFRVPAPRR